MGGLSQRPDEHRRVEDAAVAIVGYGPVGATLAILLGQLGQRVVVLERWPEPYPLPRAVHLDHEIARIFQACGLADDLVAITEPADIYEWRNGAGVPLLRIGRHGVSASGWPESLMFHQPALEATLDGRARSLPGIDVRRGVEVVDLLQDADGVTLMAATGDEIRTRYVVGCDGANSTVRSLIGASIHDLGFFYDWLVVDVILHEQRVFDPLNLQVCDPARPTTLVSGGPGRRRWEFMRLPDEPLDGLDSDGRAWELLADWDVTPTNAELERRAVYTFGARVAEQWRSGRVLLAGDAAHQTPPFAGQGMCTGIRDAANLAWKLDRVLRAASPDDLLDTYQQERLPSTRQLIDFAIELGKIICVPDPDEAAARDAAMASGVGDDPSPAPPPPPIEAGVVAAGTPAAGELFLQARLEGALFDEVHGSGWRLVTVEARESALDEETRHSFGDLGGSIVVVDTPEYRRWFEERRVAWALQRPDFHLYGTAVDAAGAAELITSLVGLLTTP